MIIERYTSPLFLITLFILEATFAADGPGAEIGTGDGEDEPGKLETKDGTKDLLLRYLLSNHPAWDGSDLSSYDGPPFLPFRPVRRLGSEFLGKRTVEEFLQEGKRALGSEFLGKRRLGSEFLGKRRLGSEFLGKRKLGSEFLGKRRLGSEFLGKRSSMEEYKEEQQQQPGMLRLSTQKQGPPTAPDSGRSLSNTDLAEWEFKQGLPNDFWVKRGRLGSEFLG